MHKILLEEGLAVEELNKKGRKRPWVRYEREHALSAVHMDWFYHRGKWVVAVLDDCSRMVLAAKECERRSVEASIAVLKEAYEYWHIHRATARSKSGSIRISDSETNSHP